MLKAELVTVRDNRVSIQVRDTKTDEVANYTYDDLLVAMGKGLKVEGVLWTGRQINTLVIRDLVKRDTPYTRGEEVNPSKYDTSEAQIKARLAITELADYTSGSVANKEKVVKAKTETDKAVKPKSKSGGAKSSTKKTNKVEDSTKKVNKKAKAPVSTTKSKKDLIVLSVNTDFRYICTSEAEIHIASNITEEGIKKADKKLNDNFILKDAQGNGVSFTSVIKGTSGVAVYPAFSPELTCPNKMVVLNISEDGKVSAEKV